MTTPPEGPARPRARRPARQPYGPVYRAVAGQVQPLQTGAGIVLGFVGYAVLLNWIRGGPAQARGWIVAKLVNKPYDAGNNQRNGFNQPGNPGTRGGKA